MSDRIGAIASCSGLCLAMLLLSCGGSHSTVELTKPPEHAVLPLGTVEAPHVNDTLRGPWPMAGWALAESGVKSVDVYVDRNYVGSATLGGDRPDVRQAFSSFTDAGQAGWSYTLDSQKLPAGRHELVVQVRSAAGSTRDIGIVPVTVAK